MRLGVAFLVLASVLAGCSNSQPVGPTFVPASVPAADRQTIGLGTRFEAISPAFNLDGGFYRVEWSVVAAGGSCSFRLLLKNVAEGPIIRSTESALTAGSPADGGDTWSAVPAGSYILQEDRASIVNCTGA